jgi:hypothetical protein
VRAIIEAPKGSRNKFKYVAELDGFRVAQAELVSALSARYVS